MSAIKILNYYLFSSIIKDIDHYMGLVSKDCEYCHRIWYNFKNEKHRIYGPAQITLRSDNRKVYYEGWLRNGKRYRHGGSHEIIYHENGNTKKEAWFKNNRFHRIDGPAIVTYYQDIKVKKKVWIQDGSWYNVNDVACIVKYNTDGTIIDAEYYVKNAGHRHLDNLGSLDEILEFKNI